MNRKKNKNREEELHALTIQLESLNRALEIKQVESYEKAKENLELEDKVTWLQQKIKNLEMLQDDAMRKHVGLSKSHEFKLQETTAKLEEWKDLKPVAHLVNDPETDTSRAAKKIHNKRSDRMENAGELDQTRQDREFETQIKNIIYSRTNHVMPGTSQDRTETFYSEVRVVVKIAGEELEKLFRLPNDDNFMFGQLQTDAATFWNLDPTEYVLVDRNQVVYSSGMCIQPEMRHSAKEIPDIFDPEEFEVFLEYKPTQEEEVSRTKKKEIKGKTVKTKIEADKWELRKERLRFMYKIELCWWILPLVAVILARALWISTEEGFHFKEALKANLLDEDFPKDVTHVKKNFFDVANSDEMYEWMDYVFYGAVDWDEGGWVADNSKMCGGFQVRNMRVTNSSCTVYERWAHQLQQAEPSYWEPDSCWNWWNSKSELTSAYGPGDGWQWSASMGWGSDTDGWAQEYGGSGYKTDFELNSTAIAAGFAQFQADRWVDESTRMVQFLFFMYNPNYDLYAAVKIFFEYLPGGQTRPGYRMEIFRDTANNGTVGDTIRMVFEYGVLGGFTLVSAIWQIVEMIRGRRDGVGSYLTEWWNLIEWVLILLSLGFLITRILWVTSYDGAMNAYADSFQDHERMYYLFWINLALLGVMGMFMVMKALKFMALYVRFGAMSSTICRAAPGIAVQLANFMVYYFAFGFMGYELFGSRSEGFCTMGRTLATMFLYTIGAFDYDDIEQANPVVAPLYFLGFQGLVFFVLLNIFVGVVLDSMAKVMEERGEMDFALEWADFKESLKSTFSKKDQDSELMDQVLADLKV